MRRPPPMDDDRKRRWKFGQNFLVDESVVRQIAEDAAPRKDDWVIEIGPGAGEDGGKVVAAGPPAAVAKTAASRTAPYLARFLA